MAAPNSPLLWPPQHDISESPMADSRPSYTVQLARGGKADLVRAVELFLAGTAPSLKYVMTSSTEKNLPMLVKEDSDVGGISGDSSIAKFLASGSALIPKDPWAAAQVDQWMEVYSYCAVSTQYSESLPDTLESYLASKSFLAAYDFSLADLAIALVIKKLTKASFGVNTKRWLDVIEPRMPTITPPTMTYPPKKVGANASAGKESKAAASAAAKTAAKEEEGGSCPPLENAIDGQVCTRFPPEPSGYLHIGHAKAVLLNQYYAQRYNGRLLVRFDDTNPTKEKEEFEENILNDLRTLEVKYDVISHSSDHFAKCEELARKMIREGNAYMDDTDQETMQAERMERKESKRRNESVEWNLNWFEKLLKGDEDARGFCMRAKIDMNSVNGTMRDPVMYRYNATPHHRTGTKFKAYPTYDFVCPILDAIEGVTHALRTTEYNDRDEQYHWIQKALGLRHVYIQAFGKMNFVNTVLSKRKLTWFVDNKLVEGWFDPRFPTIQGCVRRGVNVQALKNFIISQGASRRVITMEWDKFWSENKKVLEETAPRYMGVHADTAVPLYIDNMPAEVTFHTVQIHPQKPEIGNRVMRRSNVVYMDQIDAATYSVNEEITLLRWGNVKITSIEKSPEGAVVSMHGTYDPDATNFSKTKKATWLAKSDDVLPAIFMDYDHLISKAKLADEENFQDFINPNSKSEARGLVDPCLRSVSKGQVIQLERKGFYICDKPYGGPEDPIVLIYIPDGKAKPAFSSAPKK